MVSNQIPLFDALQKHLQSNPLPLHVPGHKMGRGLPGELAAWMGQIGRLDLTELPGLDDLHQPQGAIQEAQQLAARAFKSDETFFLVGGSTAGNMAMILTACRPGDVIIVPRNAHKSVHNAVILAGARPVYIYPEIDVQFGIPTILAVEEVKRVLEEYPEAKAVLLTTPTYQGVCSDIQLIAKEVHRCGKLLLVDEAHGAHFSFHDNLPVSAMESGADLAVQSTHKMLGSFTGSAMLHGRGNRYDGERLRMMLGMIQTSSPSYLLMLSLDFARYQMETEGNELLQQALTTVQTGSGLLSDLQGIRLYQGNQRAANVDPFKWWIQVCDLGISGYKAEEYLRKQKGIFFEMADEKHILAVFSYADTEKQIQRLLDGLYYLSEEFYTGESQNKSQAVFDNRFDFGLEQVMAPKDALHSSRCNVKLEVATGQVAAEPVIPYPPGIPMIVPGERYSRELVDSLLQMKSHGARFQGIADPSLEFVQVIE